MIFSGQRPRVRKMHQNIEQHKKKIAFFVEGQTELIFLTELLFAYLGHQNLRVEQRQADGPYIKELTAVGSPPEETIYDILIVDCQGDARVLSAIDERQKYLKNKEYSQVIGLRDLYNPQQKNVTHEALKAEIADYLETIECLIPSNVFIAVMEVEAWFLCVPDFFGAVNAALDPATVTAAAGFDLTTADIEAIGHPARVIQKVFRSIGDDYDKSKSDAYRIAKAIDYNELLLTGPERSASLREFVDHIQATFS